MRPILPCFLLFRERIPFLLFTSGKIFSPDNSSVFAVDFFARLVSDGDIKKSACGVPGISGFSFIAPKIGLSGVSVIYGAVLVVPAVFAVFPLFPELFELTVPCEVILGDLNCFRRWECGLIALATKSGETTSFFSASSNGVI